MLTDTDRTILDAWGRSIDPGRRLSELEAVTGMSRHRLNLRLSRLIDTREALEEYPVTVNRLRRLRGARQRSRRVRG